MKRDQLYASLKCGSVIVEMACALASYPIDIIDLEWGPNGVDDPRLAAVNPLSQVPTLAITNGDILTESSAIILFLADRYPESQLAPPVRDDKRAAFLRWLMFINASVYPTFTYGDFPEKWAGEAGADRLKETTLARRTQNYGVLEANAAAPFFLGAKMSAIDLYIVALVTWTPGKSWFEQHTPKLVAIAQRVKQNIFLRGALARNNMSD
jgi:GST-like protein